MEKRINFKEKDSVFYFEGLISKREFGEFVTDKNEKLQYCKLTLTDGSKDFGASCSVDSEVANFPLFTAAGFGLSITLQRPQNGTPYLKYRVVEVLPYDAAKQPSK